MTKYFHMHVIAVAISTLTAHAFAQETDPSVAGSDRDSLVRATQVMRKIDKDGIMVIRNAGHNWRKVDADIDPPREVIIQRTVQFFVEHLQQ